MSLALSLALPRAATAKPRCRYAPSPTGALHLGNARTALLAWLQARALGGTLVMRIEDLDRARAVPGATAGILEDLRWLGLDWDEGPDVAGEFGPYVQSDRCALYEEAIAQLLRHGLAFECYCTRGEIAAVASAPHGPSEDGPRYPGTCRVPDEALERRRASGRKPALRFRVEAGPVPFDDELCGRVEIDVGGTVGDFVIRRADGIHAYQLAAAIDDAAMGISHVLRGDDLVASTPRQILLLRALGLAVPRYCHVPLLHGEDGKRLSKRHGDVTVAWYRQQGVKPERLVAELARSCGLSDRTSLWPRDLVSTFDARALSREPGILRPQSLL